jgi:hypothetical protein
MFHLFVPAVKQEALIPVHVTVVTEKTRVSLVLLNLSAYSGSSGHHLLITVAEIQKMNKFRELILLSRPPPLVLIDTFNLILE